MVSGQCGERENLGTRCHAVRSQGAWALELVRTATWLGNFSFVVGRML